MLVNLVRSLEAENVIRVRKLLTDSRIKLRYDGVQSMHVSRWSYREEVGEVW